MTVPMCIFDHLENLYEIAEAFRDLYIIMIVLWAITFALLVYTRYELSKLKGADNPHYMNKKGGDVNE